MPVAAVVATAVAGPQVVDRLAWPLPPAGLGLAVLVPVVPFILELIALRRLSTAAFGTLMSLEPAIATVIGLALLGQTPGPLAAAGVALVVIAGVGAERTGARAGARAGAPSGGRPPEPGPDPGAPVSAGSR
ncbi:EamA family transporter [Actinomadura rifamycini]|uniref:EamA family transporter n=1 Tax=Actinomadura rifamycini TaxID=31962 RepID=UPI0004285D8E|nr:EamA family transporter [Actinomadura rifamycini]